LIHDLNELDKRKCFRNISLDSSQFDNKKQKQKITTTKKTCYYWHQKRQSQRCRQSYRRVKREREREEKKKEIRFHEAKKKEGSPPESVVSTQSSFENIKMGHKYFKQFSSVRHLRLRNRVSSVIAHPFKTNIVMYDGFWRTNLALTTVGFTEPSQRIRCTN